MSAIQHLLTGHLDIWTAADTGPKSGRGRSSANAASVYGIRKLRELILELAVRGKLVPQDAADEPAGELLKRIQVEKENLVKAGKAKKDKQLAEITDEDKSFKLPSGWEVAHLQAICSYIQRGKGPVYADIGSVRVVSQKCVQWKGFDIEQSRYVSDESLSVYQEERFLQNYDLLWNSTGTGTVGRIVAIQDIGKNELVADSHVTIIRPVAVNSRFLCVYISSPNIQKRIEPGSENTLVSGTTNQVELNTSSAMSVVIPIPPLAEQHRIVAKVDELMALCDQLEAEHNNASAAHEKLVSQLLATLTQSQSAEDFSANWQRIAAHFDTLFTTEASIDALKQTLLQLAVMGKLVPQDPNDEPAGELLKRIQDEKAKLIAEGKIKKEKPLSPITDEEKPFLIQKAWEWIRLGNLVEKSGSGWSPSCEGHPRTGCEWGVLKVSAVSWGKFLPNENKALPANLEARPEHEVVDGDFLVSRANTAELVARSVIAEETPSRLMLSDKIVRLKLVGLCDRRFVNLANSVASARQYYSEVAGGTSSSMKNVTREQILHLLIPLPPLAEQHRIVTKVDELMALCDQLKSRLTEASQLQQKLADVLVENAVGNDRGHGESLIAG